MDRCSILVQLPVQWGDQDSLGHVNNVVYFRWFETARIAYFDRLGAQGVTLRKEAGPILAATNCDFRIPLKHPDTVRVGSQVTRIGRTSIQMDYSIYSQALGVVAAEGSSTVVLFDFLVERPTPVTDELRAAISRIEGKTF